MEIVSRPIASLKPHPLNASIYDAEREDATFRRSIAEGGILHPLIIDQHGTILSGHRRWRAALALSLETVPTITHHIDDPLDAETVLIESNRQREKTASDIMREAERLRVIEAERARKRQLAGMASDLQANLPEGPGQTRDKVAARVGLKTGTFRNIKTVWDAAHDEGKPAEVREVAREQLAALDAGRTKPYAAVRALKQAEPAPDPFADHPEVLAARRVKNARRALESVANLLTYYTPEQMVDAVAMQDRDIVSDDLERLGEWIAAYRRTLARRRAGLSVVQ